jgi:hypothetical protein
MCCSTIESNHEGSAGIQKKLTALGKAAGPPWGKDQKDAALAAMVALAEGAKTGL